MIKELRQNKHLNRLEFLSLTKSYLTTYFMSLANGDDRENRKKLLTNLKDYLLVTKEENAILSYLISNFDKIKNFDTLESILDKLDLVNEVTFKHFNSLGEDYMRTLESREAYSFPTTSISSLVVDSSIEKEVIGLTLSKEDLLSYYHKEDAIYYLFNHTKTLDNNLDDTSFYGCYPITDKNTLKEIRVCVPPITNLKSMLINIHEYRHGIDLYPFLGKNYPSYDYESSAKQEEINFQKTLSLRKGKD